MKYKYTIGILIIVFSIIAISYGEEGRYAASDNNKVRSSPADHILKDEIEVFEDKAVINKENLIWAKIKNTHSMEPTLNKDSITLEIKPEKGQIEIGDIISFKQKSITIIHRVVDIEADKNGIYYITKGDNNKNKDDYKVRFDDIQGLVVGILY